MNNVTIAPTKFVDARDGHITLGVRVYDDYAQAYDNTWDRIPDDDMEVLDMVLELDDETICETMNYVEENEMGISIGNNYYTWDQIKSHFEAFPA